MLHTTAVCSTLQYASKTDRDLVHDPDFRQSEKDWFSFVEKLTERLAEIDDTIPELPVKDIVGSSLPISVFLDAH